MLCAPRAGVVLAGQQGQRAILLAVTELMRCDDQWYNSFLRQCRIGNCIQRATLEAAFADVQHWSSKASMTSQIAAYVCLSQVKQLQSMCDMQPFSTFLFAKGNPAGPERLVRKL